MLSVNRSDTEDLSREEKELGEVEERATQCRLFTQKIRTWLNRNERRFSLIEGKRDRWEGKAVQERFNKFMEKLGELVDEAEKEEDDAG